MAIAQFGVIVTGLRGTVGGATFSANKAGPYVKSWARGANPRTNPQSLHRNALSTWAAKWRTLSSSDQADWDTYAADPAQEKTNSLGEPYYVSGFAWYVTINLALHQAGAAERDTFPTLTRPSAPVVQDTRLFQTGAGSSTRVQFDASDPNATLNRVILIRLRNSLGVNSPGGKATFMRNQVQNASRIVTFQTPIQDAFGTILENQRMYAESYTQDSQGQRSPATTTTADSEA